MDNNLPHHFQFMPQEEDPQKRKSLLSIASSQAFDSSKQKLTALRKLGMPDIGHEVMRQLYVPPSELDKPTSNTRRMYTIGDGAYFPTKERQDYLRGSNAALNILNTALGQAAKDGRTNSPQTIDRTNQAARILEEALNRNAKLRASTVDNLPGATRSHYYAASNAGANGYSFVPFNAQQRLNELKQHVRKGGGVIEDVNPKDLGGADGSASWIRRKGENRQKALIKLTAGAGAGTLVHELGHILDDLDYWNASNSTKGRAPGGGTRDRTSFSSDLPYFAAGGDSAARLATSMLEGHQQTFGETGYPTAPDEYGGSHPEALWHQGYADALNRVRSWPIHAAQNHPVLGSETRASFKGQTNVDKLLPGLLTQQDRSCAWGGVPTYQAGIGGNLTQNETNQVINNLRSNLVTPIKDLAPPSVYNSLEDASRTRMQYFDPRRWKYNPHRSVNV